MATIKCELPSVLHGRRSYINFDVLLTVHLSIILATDQLNAKNLFFFFNLITVQQDATYSFYYISVGSSTFFGC